MLVVIEGVDGSGKQTHAGMLCARLRGEGKTVRDIHFPDYQSESSALVRMYLSGAFGDRPEAVNPYVASSFYAVDRIASYLTQWRGDYERGALVVADRYTTSNAVHQACKLAPAQRQAYLDWLFSYEYGILGLPAPDLVVFLDMPPSHSLRLISGRDNKITGEAQKDIHEKDRAHLYASYENALDVARRLDWSVVRCARGERLRPLAEIHEEIYEMIKRLEGEKS